MTPAALAFAVTTTTFKPNAAMPVKTAYNKSGCTGGNRSPELHWRSAPAGTRSFAIVMHDPDAPAPGGWYHWVVYNIPRAQTELGENAAIPNARLGTTSWGEAAYGGPCPPPGKAHHYNTTVYALDVQRLSGNHLTGPQLEAAIAKHTLGKATITGLYSAK